MISVMFSVLIFVVLEQQYAKNDASFFIRKCVYSEHKTFICACGVCVCVCVCVWCACGVCVCVCVCVCVHPHDQ